MRIIEIFKLFGSIMIEDKAAMNSLSKVDKEGSKLAGGFGKLGGIIASAFSVAAVIGFGKKIVEASANLQAMESQFSQVFKDDNAQAVDRITKQVDELGIHADRLTGTWNKFGGQIKGAGMDGEKALEAVDKATRLAADGAAFFDQSLETSSSSLASFMKGNFAAGDSIGVFTSAKQMDVKANDMYGKSWADLSESERQWLLLDTVEKTYEMNGAMGQATREAGAYENTMGNLKATLERLWATLGAPVLEVFLVGVQKVSEGVLGLTEKVKEMDWSKFEGMKDIVLEFLEPFIETTQRLGDKATEIWEDSIKPFIVGFIDIVKELYEENKDKLDLVLELFNAVASFIETRVFPIFVGLFNVVKDNFDKIKIVIQSVINIISGVIEIFIGLLTGDWDRMVKGLLKVWSGLWSGIKAAVDGAWTILSGAFKVLWDAVSGWFVDLATDALQWGKNIVQGLWDGIVDKSEWLLGKVKGFIEGIKNVFTRKDGFDINSPSKLMMTFGLNIVQGLAAGITENENLPITAMKALGDKLSGVAQTAINGAMAILTNAQMGQMTNDLKVLNDLDKKNTEKRLREDLGDDKYNDLYGQGVDSNGLLNNSQVGARQLILESMSNYVKSGFNINDWQNTEHGQFWTDDKYTDRYGLTGNDFDAMKGVATITQTIIVNSPQALNPSVIAKETKKAAQNAVLPLLR